MIDFNWDEIGKTLDRMADEQAPKPYTKAMSAPTEAQVDAAAEWVMERGFNPETRDALSASLPGDLPEAVMFLMRLANGLMWYDPDASKHAAVVLHVAIRIILDHHGIDFSSLGKSHE